MKGKVIEWSSRTSREEQEWWKRNGGGEKRNGGGGKKRMGVGHVGEKMTTREEENEGRVEHEKS